MQLKFITPYQREQINKQIQAAERKQRALDLIEQLRLQRKREEFENWLKSVGTTLESMEVYVEDRVEKFEARRKKRAKALIPSQTKKDYTNPSGRYLFHVVRYEKTHNIFHARKARKLEKHIGFMWRDITDLYEED